VSGDERAAFVLIALDALDQLSVLLPLRVYGQVVADQLNVV